MDRKTQWVCLAGGVLILLYGLKKLYETGDWVLLILGGLIIGFSSIGTAK